MTMLRVKSRLLKYIMTIVGRNNNIHELVEMKNIYAWISTVWMFDIFSKWSQAIVTQLVTSKQAEAYTFLINHTYIYVWSTSTKVWSLEHSNNRFSLFLHLQQKNVCSQAENRFRLWQYSRDKETAELHIITKVIV